MSSPTTDPADRAVERVPDRLEPSMSEQTIWSRMRRYLLTGIVVIAPVGVTAAVLWWIFQRLDAIVGRLLSAIVGVRIPGLGLLALLLLLIVVGWVAQQAMGRQLIGLAKRWLSRFPLTRSIYNAASQIIETVVGTNRKLFKGCVLVEYPRAGLWTLGFMMNRASLEIKEAITEDSAAVFVPTAPNPTSGYIVFVPERQLRHLEMSVEDGFKLVLSGGAWTPEMAVEPTTHPIMGGTGERRIDS